MTGIETTGADHRQTGSQGGLLYEVLEAASTQQTIFLLLSCLEAIGLTPCARKDAFSSMIDSLATGSNVEAFLVRAGHRPLRWR